MFFVQCTLCKKAKFTGRRTLDFLSHTPGSGCYSFSQEYLPVLLYSYLHQSDFAPIYVFDVNFLRSQPLVPASQLLRCLLRDWCGQVVGKSIPRLAESDSKVHSESITKCKVQTIFLWHNGAHKSFYFYICCLMRNTSSTRTVQRQWTRTMHRWKHWCQLYSPLQLCAPPHALCACYVLLWIGKNAIIIS